jgi:hypothetical protein
MIATFARRLTLAATVALAACSGNDSTSPAALPASAVSVVNTIETATVGRALATPFEVRVTDAAGAPVAGATVSWAVAAGGGTLSSATSTSGSNGVASVRWVPGTATGEGQVVATAAGATARFNVQLVADAPVSMAMVGGESQEALVGSELASPLALLVRDQYGNGVTGVGVRWEVRSSDASDLLFDASPKTNDGGRAFALFRVGSDAGERHVVASITGLGDVAFRVSAFLPPPGVEQLPDTMVVGVRRRK